MIDDLIARVEGGEGADEVLDGLRHYYTRHTHGDPIPCIWRERPTLSILEGGC